MAEYLLRAMISENKKMEIKNWEILSAGISAVKGAEVNQKVRTVMGELNIDLGEHSSRNLEELELKKEDLIITMTRKHSRALVLQHPGLADKIFTLKELSKKDSDSKDIQDPFGLAEEVYRETRDEIKKNLRVLLEKLKKIELNEED